MTFWTPEPIDKLEELTDQPGIEEVANLNGWTGNQSVAVELLVRLIRNQEMVNGLLVERIQLLESSLENLEGRLDSRERREDPFGNLF